MSSWAWNTTIDGATWAHWIENNCTIGTFLARELHRCCGVHDSSPVRCEEQVAGAEEHERCTYHPHHNSTHGVCAHASDTEVDLSTKATQCNFFDHGSAGLCEAAYLKNVGWSLRCEPRAGVGCVRSNRSEAPGSRGWRGPPL